MLIRAPFVIIRVPKPREAQNITIFLYFFTMSSTIGCRSLFLYKNTLHGCLTRGVFCPCFRIVKPERYRKGSDFLFIRNPFIEESLAKV